MGRPLNVAWTRFAIIPPRRPWTYRDASPRTCPRLGHIDDQNYSQPKLICCNRHHGLPVDLLGPEARATGTAHSQLYIPASERAPEQRLDRTPLPGVLGCRNPSGARTLSHASPGKASQSLWVICRRNCTNPFPARTAVCASAIACTLRQLLPKRESLASCSQGTPSFTLRATFSSFRALPDLWTLFTCSFRPLFTVLHRQD